MVDMLPGFTGILASVLSSSVVSGVVIFVSREWISNRISNRIRSEYIEKEERLKAALQGELEGTRAGYRKLLDENQVRFSRLHAEQANSLKKLHQLMAQQYQCLAEITSPLRMGNDESIARRDADLREAIPNKIRESVDFLSDNRILFPPDLVERVENLQRQTRSVYVKYLRYYKLNDLESASSEQIDTLQDEAFQEVMGEMRLALEAIEGEFRRLLGVRTEALNA